MCVCVFEFVNVLVLFRNVMLEEFFVVLVFEFVLCVRKLDVLKFLSGVLLFVMLVVMLCG